MVIVNTLKECVALVKYMHFMEISHLVQAFEEFTKGNSHAGVFLADVKQDLMDCELFEKLSDFSKLEEHFDLGIPVKVPDYTKIRA
jgi:hypothetical protein